MRRFLLLDVLLDVLDLIELVVGEILTFIADVLLYYRALVHLRFLSEVLVCE